MSIKQFMMNMSYRKTSLILGIIITIVSFSLAFLKVNHWFHGGIFGILLIFDYLNSKNNKNTSLSFLFNKEYKNFFKIYILLALVGVIIELIGNYYLKFWYYSKIPWFVLIFTVPLLYPIILMSFREMYEFLKVKVKFPFILSMLIGIIIWEIPNMISKDWIYTLPIEYKIFNLNIIIILGWSVLIGLPILVYRYLDI